MPQLFYYCIFFFLLDLKPKPSNPLAFKAWLVYTVLPFSYFILFSYRKKKKNNVSWYMHMFLKYKFYLCLPYHAVLWKVANLGSLLNLIIWYFSTTVCLILTCQISFCSHIFHVCVLNIDNSGWCKSLSAFNSENVIKKENAK